MKEDRESSVLANIPHIRVSIIQNINASFFIPIDLIAPDDAFSVANDDNARAKATVYLIALWFYFCTCRENKSKRKEGHS